MRRKRKLSQKKEENKAPEKQLNKMERSNLLDSVFKTLVIKMLNEHRGRLDKLRENFNIIKMDMETIKRTS